MLVASGTAHFKRQGFRLPGTIRCACENHEEGLELEGCRGE